MQLIKIRGFFFENLILQIVVIIFAVVILGVTIHFILKDNFQIPIYCVGVYSLSVDGAGFILSESTSVVINGFAALSTILLVILGALELRMDKRLINRKSRAITISFVGMTVITFIILIAALQSFAYFLLLFPVTAMVGYYFIHQMSAEEHKSISETIKWFYHALEEKWGYNWESISPNMKDKTYESVSSFSRILLTIFIPCFGIFLGIFDFAIEQAGLLAILFLALTISRDLRSWLTKKTQVLPFEELAVFEGMTQSLTLVAMVDAVGLLGCFFSFSVIVREMTYLDEWIVMWLSDYLLLIILTFIHISQVKGVSSVDTITHRISDSAYIALLLMFIITGYYFRFIQILAPYFGEWTSSLIVFAIWVVSAISLFIRSLPKQETSDVRFISRAGIHFSFSMFMFFVYYSFYHPIYSVFIVLVGAAATIDTASFRTPLPLQYIYVSISMMFLAIILHLMLQSIIATLVFVIPVAILLGTGFYRISWRKLGPIFMSDETTREVLFMALDSPLTADRLQKELGIERERAIEILNTLRKAEILDVRGTVQEPEFVISSDYYHEKIKRDHNMMMQELNNSQT